MSKSVLIVVWASGNQSSPSFEKSAYYRTPGPKKPEEESVKVRARLTERLRKYGLMEKTAIVEDGNCLFRACADQVRFRC